jgi:hypothetical protein
MKIALCISGETREYNDYFGPSSFINYLRSKGAEVDIYGHTWTHCNVPEESDTIKFKELLIEDQTIIDDWVNLNPMKNGWDTKKEPHVSADEWFEEVYHNTRVKIGQHIGGFNCLRMPDAEQYDIVIRWRWDLGIMGSDIKHDDGLPEHEHYLLDTIFYPKLEWASTRIEPLALTSSESYYAQYGPCVEDTYYLFNKRAMRCINKLDLYFQIIKLWEGGKIGYHTLWNRLLADKGGIKIGTHLPNVTKFYKSTKHDNDPIYK